ncbi:MAG: T9SS type A sorting domain-containing protein [Bacteroidia bacterium]
MKNIIIALIGMATILSARGQDAVLSYQHIQGAKDTVLVFGQSSTTSTVSLNALTSSILFEQQASFEGFESMLNVNWGQSAEHQAEEQISKSYNGQSFGKQWNYGIAALAQAGIQLPASTDPKLLLFKAWFSNASAGSFYVENKTESLSMNELSTGAEVMPVLYAVQAPVNQLPVSFLSFRAKAATQAIELDWTTANEINNEGFAVERSENASDFEAIAWVEGAGTASNVQQYAFTDRAVAPERVYYYRLRQVDINGQSNYSELVEARLNQSGTLTISNCYPNPAAGFSEVSLSAKYDCQIDWKIMSVMGKTSNEGSLEMRAQSSQQFEIPVSELAPGTYIVQFVCNEQVMSRKLILN